MIKDPARRHRLLFLCFWLSVGLTSLVAQAVQAQEEGGYVRKVPFLGCRVIEVTPKGQAERGGIQVMDLLSKYGEFTVVDHSTYYKAREAYLKNPTVKVPVEFWRGHEKIVIEVYPGRLGIRTNEYGAVAYQLNSEMMHIDSIKGIPDYLRNVEFKEEFENQGVATSLAKVREMIDKAEGDGTLTATQILVARINLILDNASDEELKQQDVLLAEFMRSQPAEYVGFLGESMLDTRSYRPARALLKHYLLTDPDNVAVRQNLGYASFNLGLWDEAEAAADLVLTNPHALSKEELRIAYYQKALGAMNRGDYNTSMIFAEKGFALGDGDFELLTIQLLAAITGNVEKLHQALELYEEDMKEKTENYQLKRASVEALALAMSGQTDQARAIVARWSKKDRAAGRIKDFWRHFPLRDKVVENWTTLLTSQN